MSRMPRILSQTGLYHVVCRGINRQNIFGLCKMGTGPILHIQLTYIVEISRIVIGGLL
jgi:hypothetical protein